MTRVQAHFTSPHSSRQLSVAAPRPSEPARRLKVVEIRQAASSKSWHNNYCFLDFMQIRLEPCLDMLERVSLALR